MNVEHKLTVAVITSTVGRASLARTIQSVQNQSYPCTHYIFVDGEQYHQAVREIVQPYPDVKVIYLPMNTGNTDKKLLNSAIYASAPYLVEQDIICYLDDDNWYDEHHIQNLVQDMDHYQADYAYNLRYFVDQQGEIICADHIESIGFWRVPYAQYKMTFPVNGEEVTYDNNTTLRDGHLIDTNCFAVRRELAQRLAPIWLLNGGVNDRNITQFLLEQKQLVGLCTGQYGIYYTYDTTKFWVLSEDMITSYQLDSEERQYLFRIQLLKTMNKSMGDTDSDEQGKFAWQYKTLLKNGELVRLI